MSIYVREGVKIYVKFHVFVAKLYMKFPFNEVPKLKHNLEVEKKTKQTMVLCGGKTGRQMSFDEIKKHLYRI